MTHAKMLLGYSTFGLAAAGLIVSFQLVNEAIPLKISTAEATLTRLPAPKEDRLGPFPIKADKSHETVTEAKPRLGGLCIDMEGKPFSWSWPNIPFAAMTCDHWPGK